ncbi:MAG: patatin-like phospholipase family protein [Nitratireductor sp.]|nr:patatin-like phospholipase family protein [Nitratireductor sp.]
MTRTAAAAMIVVALASGCVQRPKEAAAIRTIQPMEAVDANATAEQVLARTATSTVENDGVHTVLALSAGGSDGAYGAGVLNGWTRSGTRPQFDVVTGVSTGALMAVLAFLGPEYDGKLEEFYTRQSNDKIYKARGVNGLFGDSLYDNGPLKAQIEAFVTPEILAKIAAEHAKGRRLYVGTTNLDAGDFVIWDMGEIASGSRSDSVLHFQKVLRASAAVPAYFPPVYIKPQRGIELRQAHVDGGVKSPILVTGFMFPEGKQKKELYMVINGNTTKLNASVAVKPTLADIAQKSIVEMMRVLQEETVYRDFVLARNIGSSFHLTQIPDSIPLSNEGLDFDAKRMRQLYDAGVAEGLKGPSTWMSEPPKISQHERVAAN